MAHEAQVRYSSLVLAKMRAENILKDGIIFNSDYEGDPVAGSVKVPVRDDEVRVGDYDRSAGYSMARALDTDGASTLISQGTRVNISAVTSGTVYSDVVNIRTLMSKANVPNDGRRYLLVTPDIYAEMLKSPLFVSASALGSLRSSGAVSFLKIVCHPY